MKTKDLNLLDALMIKAVERFTPVDIINSLEWAVEQINCDEDRYSEALYNILIERWTVDGVIQQIVDYNEDLVIKKVDNIHDKYQVEQLIKNI